MNYGQMKKKILSLINSATLNGESMDGSYNGQADMLAAIPGLIDDAQRYIAAVKCPIPASKRIGELESRVLGAAVELELPEDCMRVCALMNADGTEEDYTPMTENSILIPPGSPERILRYLRCPVSVGETPEDELPMDNSPQVQEAVAYHAAAQLVMYDDAYRYAALHNEFETRLSRLSTPKYTHRGEIEDVYGFGVTEIG